VDALSAGQRRRAALARLDSEPTGVVLLDEPFAELDTEAGALLHAALARAREAGRAVVIATHGHEELDRHAARVARLAGGRLAG
ncbi:MAG: ABC transporter ATP-binding protein, partial [Candidatus Limnocylindria bacterium]